MDLTYDRNSNITSADDTILTAGTNSIPGYDVKYTMDDLNRLIQAEEGTLSSGSISSRSRDEWWKQSGGSAGLSPTGTWLNHRLDLDGNGAFSGTNELDETSTFNKVNEQLTRQPTTSVSPVYSQTHDAAGRQTDDGRDYTYKFDGFGRLKEVRNRSGGALVAEYSYNGLNFRTGWHYDVTRSGGGAPDGTVDGNDPWYWFIHNERWQVVGTFRGSDANPKERFIHHGAGLSGAGGSSYIDGVVCLDRDLSNGWAGAADGTLETRFYINQNWRGDVAVVTDDVGIIQERIKYSAYGVPTCLASADYDGNGTVNSTDYTKFQADVTANDPLADFNFDGSVDFFDYLDFTAAYSVQLGSSNGRGVLSRSAVGNRFGYAGYQWDPAIAGAAVLGGKWHVRHRVLDAERGTWLTRDPMGYHDGEDLYEYVRGGPVKRKDPSGLISRVCNSGGCLDTRQPGLNLPPDAVNPQTPNWNPTGPPIKPRESCERDTDPGPCQIVCAGIPDDAGGTPHGPGGNPLGFCCVCTGNIQRDLSEMYIDLLIENPELGADALEGWEQTLNIRYSCTEAHEKTHLNQCGGDESCYEHPAYTAEANCLESKKYECRTNFCRHFIQKRINDTRARALQLKTLCDLKKATRRPGDADPETYPCY